LIEPFEFPKLQVETNQTVAIHKVILERNRDLHKQLEHETETQLLFSQSKCGNKSCNFFKLSLKLTPVEAFSISPLVTVSFVWLKPKIKE
jgi:hypothetical protein